MSGILDNMKRIATYEIALFFITITGKLLMFNRIIEADSIISITMIASVAGTVLIAIGWTGLLPRAVRITLLYIIDLGVTFLIISDLLFYRYFCDVLSIPVLTQASVVTSIKSSIISLIHMSDFIFAADFIVLSVIFINGKVGKRKRSTYGRRVRRVIVALVAGIALFGFGLSQLLKSQPNILKSFYDRVYVVQNIGLLGYHGIDAFTNIKPGEKKAEPVTGEKKEEILRFLKDKKAEWKQSPEYFGAGKGKNLIVVQVEALQEFVINRSINGQEITPNLNKLARNSLYFDNYYTETAGGGTSDAELLANVSMFPAKDGCAFIRFSGNKYYSLASELKKQGYYTSAMHGHRAGFWNRSVMYNSLSFDEFVSRNDYELGEIIGMGLSDKSFFRQSLEKLKKYKEPYYAILITLTSHYPYDNDKSHYSAFDVGKYKDTFFGNYLESIHYADDALGEFLEELEAEGLMDRSVLAVYGDHFGIPKDKKEYLEDFLELGKIDDYNWVKLQKVPLIIHLGDEYKGVRHIAGGGVDFMPTILNIMGVESGGIPMLGRDLLNSEEGIAILRNGNFITDKYISLTSKGVVYDASTGERIPAERLERERKTAAKHLEYSDLIMEYDLAAELAEQLE